jgi:rSAM/selenodomain-associated transferase 2
VARGVISVVIPTLNAAPFLGPTLGALGAGITAGAIREVIFADGGSDDETAAIAEAVGADLAPAPRGRGPQLRAGAAAAKGEWLLFLHADTRLSPDWPEAMLAHAAQFPDRAGWCPLRFDDAGAAAEVTAGWANRRSALFGLPYGDQGLLIARRLYHTVGGHPPIPLMEDVALARALGRRRLRRLTCVATTSAARYRREGWLRRGARNLSCLGLYFAGVPPHRIAARYERGGA